MIKKMLLPLFAIASLGLGCQAKINQKYLIILQAGTESHEGMARAVHALLYATELKKAGFTVTLIFDGAGTEWAKALINPEHKLHASYRQLQDAGVTEIICDFCSTAFQVREDLKKGKVPLVAEFEGHPSLVKWIKQGYLPIVL
ncbi:MAG: DsrE family protein [Deltaproteobacteria bacterium]|nr:DsrE family protein [Deltaproteobacteria bacterium]